jgi:protease YdgD
LLSAIESGSFLRVFAAWLALLVSASAATLPGVGTADGRVIVDGTVAPWNAVARLQIPGVSRCTAVLVGPRTAITAAHCLWNRRLRRFAPPGSVHVLTRYARENFARHSVASTVQIAENYDPARSATESVADVAVVTLAEPIGTDTLALDVGVAAGSAAMLGGYNQDRREVIEADLHCRVLGAAGGLLEHDCAGTHGTSGAPLLVRGADGAWRIAGLQVAGFTDRSGGVAVAAGVLQHELNRSGATP